MYNSNITTCTRQVPLPGVQCLSAVLELLPAFPEAGLPALPGAVTPPGCQGAGRHRGPRL